MHTPTAERIVTRHPASAMEASMDGKDLRAARKRRNLTVFDVADYSGIDPQTYHAIERGELFATEDLLRDLAALIERIPPRHPWLARIRRSDVGRAARMGEGGTRTLDGTTPAELMEVLADNRRDPEVWDAVRVALVNDDDEVRIGGGAAPLTILRMR
jgi:transcriptional regulator with XRE-family HTH domain